jgi:hypothetical protein
VAPVIRSISAPGGLAPWNRVSSVIRWVTSRVCRSKITLAEARVIKSRCPTLAAARTRKMPMMTAPTQYSAASSCWTKTRSNIGFIM